MKLFLSFIFMVLLVGCIDSDKFTTGKKSTETTKYPTTCIDGVVYFLFREQLGGHLGFGYMSPKFNRDGTVATCNESQPVRQ